MKDLNDFSIEMKSKQFFILAFTACAANTLGFLSNIVLFGLSMPTIICGICALLMIALGALGRNIQYMDLSALLILVIVNLFEFPYLYVIYGRSTMLYFILGIVGIVLFTSSKIRIVSIAVTVMIDLCTFIYCFANVRTMVRVDTPALLGAMISTYVIVVISITAVMALLIYYYEKQKNELLQLSEELREAANLDSLTKIYNRRFLTEYLDKMVSESGKSFAVALLDLDDFKLINDRFGHVFGDIVLQKFAELSQKSMNERGIVARFGGEEFMLVFETLDTDVIQTVISEIRTGLADFSENEKGETFTFSGGVEIYHKEDRITQIFNAADEKLYKAKSEGKNKVIL